MSTNIFCRGNYRDAVGVRFIGPLGSIKRPGVPFYHPLSPACETPVIVTDGWCVDLIKEAECGYLVHYGDVASLGEVLRSALEHRDVNRGMIEAGRWYIGEHLAWGSVVKQVEAMYGDCVRHV